jgi:hypothetical protein
MEFTFALVAMDCLNINGAAGGHTLQVERSVSAVWAREGKKGCQPAFQPPGWTDGLEGLGVTGLRSARHSM